jgi:hypothetical protein
MGDQAAQCAYPQNSGHAIGAEESRLNAAGSLSIQMQNDEP